MKRLPNKEFTLNGKKQTYSEAIPALIKQTPEKGFEVDDIKKVMKIDAICAKAKKEMDFEDADFEYLKSRILMVRWVVAEQSIVDFIDDIKAVK